MKFGFIGAGQVSLAISKKLIALDHQVALSSRRGPTHIADKVASLGSKAQAVEVAEAASADIVFLASPWETVEEALVGLPAWNNRILVDTTNPFLKTASGYVVDELNGRSASTIVAGFAAGARVVKAFNTMLMSNFEKGPTQGALRRVLFLSGDDTAAKSEMQRLIEAMGFAVIDLGDLTAGGRLQQGGGPIAGHDLLLSALWRLES